MAYDPLAPYLPAGSTFTTDHVTHLDNGIQGARDYADTRVDELVGEQAALNDATVGALVTDGTSATRGALDDIYNYGDTATRHGAAGDGVTDDTAALQSWLDAPGAGKYLPAGTYVVSSGLATAQAGATIAGPGTIRCATAGVTVLTVTGADTTVQGVTIDGAGTAAIGVNIQAGGAVLDRVTIENLHSADNTARGVDSNTGGGFTVRDCTIRNIHAAGDAALSNGPGMARGIVVYSATAATGDTLIESNTIDTITGEEGDGIAVLFGDSGVDPFHDSRTVIRGNIIRNCSRRFLKIQGSGTNLESNRCENTPEFTAANPSCGVGLIWSDRVQIIDNHITPGVLGPAMNITGSSTRKSLGLKVDGNHVAPNAGQPGVYAKWVAGSVISATTATGGTNTVLLGTADDVVVTSTTGDNPDGAVPVVSVDSASNRVTVVGTASTANRAGLVSNASAGGFTETLVDTGWRNVNTLVPGYTSGTLAIRRVGALVELRATSLVFTGTTMATLPLGFRSTAWIQFHTAPYWSSEVLEKFRVKNEGDIQFASHGDSNVTAINVQWFTSDPAPAALPGVAA